MTIVASSASSRSRAIAYWLTTIPVAAELAVGGVWDVLRTPYVRVVIRHLGYPGYFLVILGVWKLLGAAALLAPRLPRLKEWAYAGAVFHYTGAVVSHLAVGDGAAAVAYPILQTILVAASWALRPPARRDLARAGAARSSLDGSKADGLAGSGRDARGVALARAARPPYPNGMRILHTMIRVGDLERSLAFYTQVLGMELLRRKDYPEGRFTLAFVGFAPESEQAALELTHNWDTAKYDLGAGFGHVAIEVDDAYGACAAIKQRGGVVTREAGPMKHGSTVIAFVQDPDGYKIELIQRGTQGTA